MAKMIHSMIRVRDEDTSVAFYRDALGLSVADRFPMEGFTLVYLRDGEGEFELELTINHDHTKEYEPGSGYGHLAVSVSDLATEHTRLSGLGLSVTEPKTLTFTESQEAYFFFLTDPDGYQIEVLQRGGRYL